MKRDGFKRLMVKCGKAESVGWGSKREARWKKELLIPLEVSKWNTPVKCVNDFLVGGDPEFVLGTKGVLRFANANLWPGLAFGADQNGRLGELRITPSRSTFDLVAGTLKTLRWLWMYECEMGFRGLQLLSPPVVLYPGTERYDGCGGHVHFGRKSSQERRAREVEALDWLFGALVRGNVWFKRDCESRVHRARYGTFGDTRIQKHGFEYRVFPSWLESPWKMFLVLTLAKLTVYDPELAEWGVGEEVQEKIDLFLGYYQGRDDDARLARVCLRKWGLPTEKYGDGLVNWGVSGGQYRSPIPSCWPATFKVEEQDREEVFGLFGRDVELIFREPTPNWEPLEIPKGFAHVASLSAIWRLIGLGDLCAGLVVWRDLPVTFRAYDKEMGFLVGKDLEGMLAKGWREEVVKAGFQPATTGGKGLEIYFGHGIRRNPFQMAKAKRLLTSGLFPIWNEGEANEGKLAKWKALQVGFIKGISLRGEEV